MFLRGMVDKLSLQRWRLWACGHLYKYGQWSHTLPSVSYKINARSKICPPWGTID